jgi:glycosyltransferase involved in cell wall biosynthesis
MKLAVVSHPCVLKVNRGLSRALAAEGIDIHIVAPDHIVSDTTVVLCEPTDASDPPLTELPLRGFNARTYQFAGLLRAMRSFQPDAIYLENDPLSLMSIQLGLWSRRRGARLFCLSCENLDFGLPASIRRRGVAKGTALGASKLALLAASRPNVSHVFAINSDGAALFRHYGFRSVSQTPLGFDPLLFKPDIEARERIRRSIGWRGPLIAYFGRLVPEKGAHVLVEALAELKDLEWRFLLDRFSPQSGGYPTRIREMINAAQLQDRVLYVDADHQQIGEFMGAADIVVVPSVSTEFWREQYGRVAVEAMACGALVIAARTGALPFLVGDGGVLFEESDAKGLAVLLRQALLEPDRFKDQRQRGTRRAHQELSIGSQAQHVLEVLNQASASFGPRRSSGQ